MSKSKKKKSNKKNKKNQPKKKEQTGEFQVETTLHGYAMTGPFTPGKKDVWYCDYKKCQYTQHGVYRRYKIQNWRSMQFGKKFVLCDGCVRQFKRAKPLQQQQSAANVNVKLNINGINPGYQQQPQPQPQGYYQQPMMPMYNQVGQQQIAPLQAYNYPQQYPQQYPQPQQQQPVQIEQKQSIYSENMNGTMDENMNAYGDVDNNSNSNSNIMRQGVVKKGWMMKKGELIKSWKKRYFVLKSNKILNYYESDNAVMVKGTCKLGKVKAVKNKSDQSFEIETHKRKWCFACKDTKTRDDWVNKIKSVAGI